MGENDDPETGLPHLAHAAANVLFLLEYRRTCPNLDDRLGGRAGDGGSNANKAR